MERMFFDGWFGIVRTIVLGALVYASLIALLRFSGKRTLSKMNAFDLVVTVALGSTFATIILSKDVALIEGVVALALLVALQFAIAWSSIRSPAVQSIVKSEPALLLRRGQYLHANMKRERITQGEIMAAIRQAGFASVEDIEAVVLETDGSTSVIGRTSGRSATALADVRSDTREGQGTSGEAQTEGPHRTSI